MIVQGKHYRAIWREGREIRAINQLVLPYELRIVCLKTQADAADAISTMLVRGAGTIGATAAYGMMLAAFNSKAESKEELVMALETAAQILKATRPTAVDLANCVDRILEKAKLAKNAEICRSMIANEADKIANEIADGGRKIGLFGEKLLGKNAKILTHCNAGWLALVDYGSALAPVYEAKRKGKMPFVFVDETRPRLQGAKLTAWELSNENIAHAIIADNAAGHYMQNGEIEICLVGADRIAMNGDFANKIGTYEKAVLAKENGVPFYVAAPISTFDLKCKEGKMIPVEERNEREINYATGIDESGRHKAIRISNERSNAKNPAFDVTPAKYVTGIITPKGIIKANSKEIKRIFGKINPF